MSSDDTNTSSIDIVDKYGLVSPVECYKLNLIAVYCIVLFILSLIFNSLLLWIFFLYKELRTSLNMFVIALTAINLIGSLSEFPFVITSNIACRWIFKKVGCYISGFVMYTVGCTSVYLMAAISFERFYIIYKPLSIRHINFRVTLVVIGICLLSGLFWAFLPLIGWSYYSLEGALTSCSVEWNERSSSVVSYNIAIFIFVYILPFSLILITNLKLILIIKRMPKINKDSTQDVKTKKRLATERNLTIIMMILIGGFVLSWTPYAMVSLYSALIATDHLSPLSGTLPAMFAKSSMVWSSILYIYSNRQIRVKVGKSLFMKVDEKELSISRDNTLNNISNTSQRT